MAKLWKYFTDFNFHGSQLTAKIGRGENFPFYGMLFLREVIHDHSSKGLCAYMSVIEPRHEISNNVVCATSKASDQPAHTRSLARAFTSRLGILWLLNYWPNIIWNFEA